MAKKDAKSQITLLKEKIKEEKGKVRVAKANPLVEKPIINQDSQCQV